MPGPCHKADTGFERNSLRISLILAKDLRETNHARVESVCLPSGWSSALPTAVADSQLSKLPGHESELSKL